MVDSVLEVQNIKLPDSGGVTSSTAITLDASGVVDFPNGATFFGQAAPIAHFQHTESAGTSGGTSSTSWAARTINTTKKAQSWATLSSNQITLSAGTYYLFADPHANTSGRIMSRFYNVTDSSVWAYGLASFSNAGEVQANSFINHFFTLASSKVFEIQMRVQSSKATSGYGIDYSAIDASVTNTYLNVIIQKFE